MSLMLDALKRIEAKQTSVAARNAAVPVEPMAPASCVALAEPCELLPASGVEDLPKVSPEEIEEPSPAAAFEPIELPPALAADDLASLSFEDFAFPEPLSLEAALDQLQDFVSEADSLYDSAPESDVADLAGREKPAAGALQIVPQIEDPAPPANEVSESEAALPPMPDADFDWPDIGFTDEMRSTEAESPVASDPFAETGLPVVAGVVEEALAPESLSSTTWDAAFEAPSVDVADDASLPEAEPPVVAPVASDPYSATAERILHQLPRGRSQVLLFTSPADGHGKTMTLARLAPLLAQGLAGNVLVVDANFRNPDMARWLAVAAGWRLPEVLAGGADWAMAVQPTAHERVSLLPGGADAYGFSPSRSVQRLTHLLRELAGHYDLVIVDASSLAHRGTVQLSAVCDATYLVVRLGEGSPRMLREAGQVVQRSGGRLMGCVAVA